VTRCDRCGAGAKAQVITPSGDVLLCGHHWSQHAPALTGYPVLPLTAHVPQRV
jgi:hypothetical protein